MTQNIFDAINQHDVSTGKQPQFATDRQPEPTRALPGTQEKLDVLARRVMLGQELWSDEDLDDWSAP